jgi:hypothetical protein
MDSAACSRSSVRQRPNGTPASAANARASVCSVAPTSRPHSRSPEWAAHIQDDVLPQTTGFTAITLRVAHNLIFTAGKEGP